MLEFGGYTVELLEDEKLQGFTIRKLSVLENQVVHFQYISYMCIVTIIYFPVWEGPPGDSVPHPKLDS